MFRLLSLPLEVLLRIIDEICPDDIENFCLCSRALRITADDALTRHRQMKRTCSAISCGFPSSDSPLASLEVSQHPVTIIKAILADKHYRFYPKEIDIGRCRFSPNEGEEIESEAESIIRRILDDLNDQILLLIENCPYLANADEVARWREHLFRSPGSVCIALAVTLLPNLRSMALENCVEKDVLIEMLVKIADANVKSPLLASTVLSKLSKLFLQCTVDCGRDDFQMLSYFAVLPSIRSIHGCKIQDQYNASISGPEKSELKELILDDSAIDVRSLSNFLKGIKALKKFRYEAGAMAFRLVQWQPHRIVAILLENAQDSLQELDLDCKDVFYSRCEVSYRTPMGSLRSFTKLKHVTVLVPMLFDKKPKSGEAQEVPPTIEDSDPEDKGSDSDASTHGQFQLLPLVETMPASLETLTLVGLLDSDDAMILFSDIAILKEERLPNLRGINLNGPPGVYRSIEQVCDELGIIPKPT